jgi:SH3-like domain-containing protein
MIDRLLLKVRLTVGIALIAISALPVGAFSATSGTDTVVSVKQDPVPVYTSPDDGSSSLTVPAQGLPWKIKASKNDYYLVNISGKDYWVDAMSVHANHAASATCLRQSAGTTIAADLGASTDHCK